MTNKEQTLRATILNILTSEIKHNDGVWCGMTDYHPDGVEPYVDAILQAVKDRLPEPDREYKLPDPFAEGFNSAIKEMEDRLG